MGNCQFHPEICEAKPKYDNDYSEHKVNRIKDAKKIKAQLEMDLKKRLKNKEWKNIYPYNNHDFDYKEYILNKYNPYKLGISNEPTVKNLSESTIKLSKYMDLMLESPTPNSKDRAGVDDINNENSVIKNKLADIKIQTSKMPLPYKDFKKDYPEKKFPITGEHSSSYFVKIGACKTKVDSKNTCINKGFKWIPQVPGISKNLNKFFTKTKRDKGEMPKKIENGYCFKPRFMYIDNSAKGFANFRGAGPAIYNDIMNISPEKLFPILAGFPSNIDGLLPCKEEFVNFKNKSSYRLIHHLIIIIITIVLLVILKFIIS